MNQILKIGLIAILLLCLISVVSAACIGTACGTNSPAGGRTATGTKCCAFFCNGNIKEYYTWYPSQTWSRAMQPLSTTNCSSLGKQCITSQYTGSDYCGTTTCTDECSPGGSIICAGTNAQKICGDPDSDGCLEWTAALPCAAGQTCSNGACTTTEPICTHECQRLGEQWCTDTGYKECENTDSDPCFEWAEHSCSTGCNPTTRACNPTQTPCTNECATQGKRTCSGNGYKICGQNDSDSCLEWGSVINCDSGETCNSETVECETDCSVSVSSVSPDVRDAGITPYSDIHFFSYNLPSPLLFPEIFRRGTGILLCSTTGQYNAGSQDTIFLVALDESNKTTELRNPPYITLSEIEKTGNPFKCRITLADGASCDSEAIYVETLRETGCDLRADNETSMITNLAFYGESLKERFGSIDIDTQEFTEDEMGDNTRTVTQVFAPILKGNNESIGIFSILATQSTSDFLYRVDLEFAERLAQIVENADPENAVNELEKSPFYIIDSVSYTGNSISIVLKERIPCPNLQDAPDILQKIAFGPRIKSSAYQRCLTSAQEPFDFVPGVEYLPNLVIDSCEALLGHAPRNQEEQFLCSLFEEITEMGIRIHWLPEGMGYTRYGGFFLGYDSRILLRQTSLRSKEINNQGQCINVTKTPQELFAHEATHALDFFADPEGHRSGRFSPEESLLRRIKEWGRYVLERRELYYTFRNPYVHFTQPSELPYTKIKIQVLAAIEFNARMTEKYHYNLMHAEEGHPTDNSNATYLKQVIKFLKKGGGYPKMDTRVRIIQKVLR